MGSKPKTPKPQPQPVIPPPPPPPVPVSYKKEDEATATRKGAKKSLGRQFLQRRKATKTGPAAFGQKKQLG